MNDDELDAELESLDDDTHGAWRLTRTKDALSDRFRLDITIRCRFTEPTAAEVTAHIASILEQVFGPTVHPDT